MHRKITSLCICAGIAVLSVFVIIRGGEGRAGGTESYTVTLRHYGVDAEEMERSVAVPLEDALSAVPGLRDMESSSENSSVRVFVRFDGRGQDTYGALREAVQGVYETLPSSVQRPEIRSSDNSRIPLWTAAVTGKGTLREGENTGAIALLLERIVKPRLESLEGVGEVEISGAGLPEISVALDSRRAAPSGLSPRQAAVFLGMNDVLLPGGVLEGDGREILLTCDSRYGDRRALEEALVPLGGGGTLGLGTLAAVREQEREPDSVSRLNGRKTVTVSIMKGPGADAGRLSRRVGKELEAFGDLPLEFQVLSDRGKEESDAFRSVLGAALEGALAAALVAALMACGGPGGFNGPDGPGRRLFPALFCALSVPFVCLVSAALLCLRGFAVDRGLLAGLSAGIGAAVDAVIISLWKFRRCRDLGEGRAALNAIKIPLISGSITTVAALVPLAAGNSSASSASAGIGSLALGIGAVTLVSLVFSLTLLPPLLLWGTGGGPCRKRAKASAYKLILIGKQQKTKIFNRKVEKVEKVFVSKSLFRTFFFDFFDFAVPFLHKLCSFADRLCRRFLARSLRFCVRRPAAVLLSALFVVLCGVVSLAAAGADTEAGGPEDSIYVHVEFEGGLRQEETDLLLRGFAERLALPGIRNVETSARIASGSALIAFDPARIGGDRVREMIRETTIPGAFVYLPETSSGERVWEIRIQGDDGGRCQELAREAAGICAEIPQVTETVLNFKDGSPRLIVIPDRRRLAGAGVRFREMGDALRRAVYGPVAYKKTGRNGEIDVRVRDGKAPSRSEITGVLVPPPDRGNPLRLDSLAEFREGREPSAIRRGNRRRSASISVRTRPADPRRIREQIMPYLERIDLPPGYTLEFDSEAIRAARSVSGRAGYFLLALIFCYMVIAAVNESFVVPLVVLAPVLPSLALPAFFLAAAGRPLGMQAACALIAVSGLAVNASVLTAEGVVPCVEAGRSLSGRRLPGRSLWSAGRMYRAIREVFPLLLLTCGTTIAGALPLLFLREGTNRFLRTMSLVTVLGVAASFIFSICLVPVTAGLLIGKNRLGIPDTLRSGQVPPVRD
ncbi:MAG: efflux RND transporter permease subunit [Treponema sp.]|jgi:multidrug efflux pump subunit AcrB|nr:efflux RND transporter permease subunit [Treponema sp.]